MRQRPGCVCVEDTRHNSRRSVASWALQLDRTCAYNSYLKRRCALADAFVLCSSASSAQCTHPTEVVTHFSSCINIRRHKDHACVIKAFANALDGDERLTRLQARPGRGRPGLDVVIFPPTEAHATGQSQAR